MMFIGGLGKLKCFFNKSLQSLIILVLCLTGQFAFAKNYGHWYSEEELKYIQSVYGENIRQLFFIDVLAHLSRAERKSLSAVEIEFPLKGRASGLFEYAMHLKTGKMYISALSVKFFDDIAIAMA